MAYISKNMVDLSEVMSYIALDLNKTLILTLIPKLYLNSLFYEWSLE